METIKEILIENHKELYLVLGYMLIEYLLGVTSKVYSNSMPELLLRGLGRVFKLFLSSRFVMAKRYVRKG